MSQADRWPSAFEVARQRHVQALQARLPHERDKLTWPLDRLHALRDERLRRLVHVAQHCSPWHARRLRGIDPGALTTQRLAQLPTMTKADLMAHWDEIVTDRRLTLARAEAHLAAVARHGPGYLLDGCMVVASGGSSGLRGVFAFTFNDWLEQGLLAARVTAWLRQHRPVAGPRRTARVTAAVATHASTAGGRTFASAAATRDETAFVPVTLPFDEIVARLAAFRPTELVTYPSILHRLALRSLDGQLHLPLHAIKCAGEPLFPETRRLADVAFGPGLVENHYVSSEFMTIAHSVPGGEGLHLVEDALICEPVDAQSRPVPVGSRAAKLLVTSVISHLLPLIRYELTDEVVFLDEMNPGPWTGRRIAAVQGRLDDLFTYPGGIDVHPHVFRSVLSRVPEVFEYQVRQTRHGAAITVRTSRPIDPEPIRRELTSALGRLGVQQPEVTLATTWHLERAAGGGKLKRFVPLAPRAWRETPMPHGVDVG